MSRDRFHEIALKNGRKTEVKREKQVYKFSFWTHFERSLELLSVLLLELESSDIKLAVKYSRKTFQWEFKSYLIEFYSYFLPSI